MDRLRFDYENDMPASNPQGAPQPGGIVAFLMRYGLAHDEQGALRILIGTVIVCIVAGGFFFVFHQRQSRHIQIHRAVPLPNQQLQ